MGDARPAAGEQIDFIAIQLDTVCVSDVIADPAQFLGILPRQTAEPFL